MFGDSSPRLQRARNSRLAPEQLSALVEIHRAVAGHLDRKALFTAIERALQGVVSSMLRTVSLVEIGQCRPVPEAQAPTGEMAVTPPSIRKSAPTTYAESSDAR